MKPQKPARLVVLAAGQGSNLQAIFQAIDDGKLSVDVALVVSHRSDAYALVRAAVRGIATAVQTLTAIKAAGGSRDDFDRWLTATIAEVEPDLIVCAGWMLILGSDFLRAHGGRTINLHPALPGAFIGKDAILQAWQAAQRGEVNETGVMVHEVIAELDAGAPIAVRQVPILPGESLQSLTERIHAVEHDVLIDAIRLKLASLSC